MEIGYPTELLLSYLKRSLPQLRLPPKSSNGWGVKGFPPVGRISPYEGVSPISSPPKPLKTPPSPQKPQKTTSPKKKNGMLSPIKTPKTPGSDTRKLPPIKAPVGLAPNPNLKNIRSKIGSFDNIRYKPGGGDKKVISTKKLEWKAAPKIGSLDHSFKSGEKKHGKGHSKGEPKEEKLVDGQAEFPFLIMFFYHHHSYSGCP
ncbi:uncharacterized protein TNIN_387731 [Trichonephila inaurata madagascariensis]|uniref:Microtubule-associated protein n=1 Tax=Trichonephila inaurata madagascariensis TaxID=2747483 RepID=A0A8X6YIR4_9ARAC|nr:uncharacterized protein TNIN_387731 [Trichonephila inaurata madagascariensis]